MLLQSKPRHSFIHLVAQKKPLDIEKQALALSTEQTESCQEAQPIHHVCAGWLLLLLNMP